VRKKRFGSGSNRRRSRRRIFIAAQHSIAVSTPAPRRLRSEALQK
jgi:hypothetical protein